MAGHQFSPLLELTRGGTVESVHCGAIAVVNPQGELLHSNGDPNTVTFLRSAAKPFQVMPFIEAGGHHHYNLTPQEIALMCASHSGTDEHVKVLSGIQSKTGVTESDLMCGAHPPYDKAAAADLIRRGEKPTPNRHNCSGKHTGMLAYARMNSEELPTYLENEHPIQTRILTCLSEMTGAAMDKIQLGTDGCSAPNFALSLYHSALAWARLADPDTAGLSPTRREACRTITGAMTAHPFMVGGPKRFDTRLMTLTEGRIVIKAGAEGYEGIGILPGALGPGFPGLGVALKITDGDGYGRARAAVSLEVLRQLGVLSPDQLAALSEFGPRRPVKNWRKLDVGEMRPVFELD